MVTDLFGETPESRSIEYLRMWEPPEGYWLAFSGGKDSVVLHELARRSGVKFEAHYNVTTIDPPEVLRFMRDHYPDLQWDKPRMTFCQGIQRNQLPMRQGRWCCEELKERGGEGRVVLTGVRAAESARRAAYGVVRPCLRGKGKTLVNPMLHWTDADVWGFIRGEGLPYCSLYDEGWARIGCICCPFERNVAESMARWPRQWEKIKQAIAQKYPTAKAWQKFGSPEAVFEWWTDRDRPQVQEDDQQMAFDQFGEGS